MYSYICLPIISRLHIYLSIHQSIYLSIHLSIYPPIHLSIYPSIYLSTHPYIHLSIYIPHKLTNSLNIKNRATTLEASFTQTSENRCLQWMHYFHSEASSSYLSVRLSVFIHKVTVLHRNQFYASPTDANKINTMVPGMNLQPLILQELRYQ